MHKLISNSPVIYNSEAQASGVLEIQAEQIIYQNDGGHYHNVMLQMPVKVSGSNAYAAGLGYNVSAENWNTFFASQTLTSIDEFGKQQEAALYYAKTQINGAWGLTENDWTYSAD